MKRFLLATGMLLALAATGVGCFMWGKMQRHGRGGPGVYTRLHVSRQPPFMLTPHSQDKEEFNRYCRNQVALIKSRLVLNSALRDPKVATLALVKEKKDPVAWLEKNLIVDFAQGSEILRIALPGDDYETLTPIVNAVREAYLKEIVHAEMHLRMDRLKQLNELRLRYEKSIEVSKQAIALLDKVKGDHEFGVQMAENLIKELPRLQLATVAAEVRLQQAKGKEAEELKMELALLQAQRQMILSEEAKAARFNKNKVDLGGLEGEIARAQAMTKRLATMTQELEIEMQAPARIRVLEDAVATDALEGRVG